MTNHFSAKISSLKNRLERLKQIVLHDYPELLDSIPSPDGIDIKKLGQHGLIMTDSCNAAQKARQLLQCEIGGIVFEFDCHNHLRNVWIKGMEKLVSVFLQVVLSDSLEKCKNACYWLGLETIHNYLVSQRCKAIGGRAGSPFEND